MPNATLTCIDFWIKAGSRYENPGEEGIAHFLEHMVFKGAHKMKSGDFDRRIESLGGSSNAATGFDDVHFFVMVPNNSVEIALDLLINLVLTPTFESSAFDIEREVVLEEIAQHMDQPDEQIIQKLLEMCWGIHPYGRPILGSPESLQGMTPKDMKLFHKRLYKGSNCSIAIAGKIPNNIEEIISTRFNEILIPHTKETIKNKEPIEILFNKRHREIKVNRLESSRLMMAWPIPPASNQKSLMGSDIATTLLAEGRRSRLIQHLREDLQIVESIEMDLTTLEQGGLVILEVCCKEEKLKEVEKEIHKVLRECIESDIPQKELKRAQQLVRNSHCFSIEASSNVASLIGSQALWGRHQPLLAPLENIEYWNVTELQNLVLSKLQPENSSTLIATP
tara:strand:- start:1010 stop:2191 length:1182 start_codon:yes stop_codon:yes gene_type:complete